MLGFVVVAFFFFLFLGVVWLCVELLVLPAVICRREKAAYEWVY